MESERSQQIKVSQKIQDILFGAMLPFVFFIIMLFAFASVGDSVYANDAQTADPIGLNSVYTYTYTEDDEDHYYKFVPPQTNYYAVDVSNFLKDRTYIGVTDASGYSIAWAGWDQYANKVRLACKLIKGKTYFICISCSVPYNDDENNVNPIQQTVGMIVTKHSHSFRTIGKYKGGVDEECFFPECYFERWRITAKPVIKKLKKGKKSFTVTWACNIDCQAGYQIQYATNAKFKGAKIKTVGWSASSKKISKLKKRKNYYVRVRAYAKAKQIDGTVTKTYGPWSKSKKIRTK